MSAPILKARGVHKRFAAVTAVAGIDLAVRRGETFGIVGESGSGKTTLARMLVGLIAPTAGEVLFEGRNIAELHGAARRAFHGKVQYVFQDPSSALNPRKTVRSILEAPLARLAGLGRDQRRARCAELMRLVNLRVEFLDRYPHEFSGGQAQRIGIARALAASPSAIVLDEPVSSLDVSIQAQILNLLRSLRQQLDLTYVFISHDLAVVENLCDRVAVMHRGRIVEQGTRAELFAHPRHDYTRTLLASVPIPGRRRGAPDP